jgi:hypothetical protein
VAEPCGACGARSEDLPSCPECGAPRGAAIDEIRFGDVVWRRGDLPTAEMRRRLARRLQAQYRVVDRWEAADRREAARELPAPVTPVAAPPPVVEEPATPRFTIPAVERPPVVAAARASLPGLLLENLGWWIGGFLLVTGAVFLVGTVWTALPGLIRALVEVGGVVALAAGLARVGVALVARGLPVGRGLAAVGLALSLVGSVAVAVEGWTPVGAFAALLAAVGAGAVARLAARTGMAPYPAWAWAIAALLPAVAWLLPALAWPVVALGLLLAAGAVRAALLERRPERAWPLLGAVGLAGAAGVLAALPATGAAVGWVLAPAAGALAVWVDAARTRWRGLDAPAFARPLPVLGAALGVGALSGLLVATATGAGPAFVGGLLGLGLVALLGRRHPPEKSLALAELAGLLLTPAALLGALGVTGDGGVSSWFVCAAFGVPAALLARKDAIVRHALVAVAALAVVAPATGTSVGIAAGVVWAGVAAWICATAPAAPPTLVAGGLLAASASAAAHRLGHAAVGSAAGWAGLALLADTTARTLRARAGSETHPVAVVARALSLGAAVLLVAAVHPLVAGRLVDTPLAALLASLAVAVAAAVPGARGREEGFGWLLLVPIAVGASTVRPLLGLQSDPVAGLVVATVAAGASAWALSRLDPAPWARLGDPARPSVDAPSGWLATPAWHAALLAALAVAAAGGVELALGRTAPAAALAAVTGAVALSLPRLDRRPAIPALSGVLAAAATGTALWVSALHPAAAPVSLGLGVAGVVLATGRGVPGAAGRATAGAVSALLVAAFAVQVTVGAAAGVVPAVVTALAAAAPVFALAVVAEQVALSALGCAMVGAALVAGAAPLGPDPVAWGLVAAAASAGASVVALALTRVDRAGSVHPAVRASALVAAGASTSLLLASFGPAREVLLPHLAALGAWGLVAAFTGRQGALRSAAALASVGFAIELGWVAHLAVRPFTDALDLGAAALAAAVAAGTLALRGRGGARDGLSVEAGPLAQIAGAVVALGAVPALLAAASPATVPAPAVAAAWGVAAAFALDSAWPVLAAVVAAAVLGVHHEGALGAAVVAAALGWTSAAVRRWSTDPDDLAGRAAEQILVPSTAIVACLAVVGGAWTGEPLAPIATLVALAALGPVREGLRAPIVTLVPAVVAALAHAPAVWTGGILSGGALALAAWSVATGAPWLLLAEAAAAAAVLVDPFGSPAANAARWLVLGATLAPRLRGPHAELALAGVAGSVAAAGAVALLPLAGPWAWAPWAVGVAVGWLEAARGLRLPLRLPLGALALAAIAALLVTPEHRAVGVAAVALAALAAAAHEARASSRSSASMAVGGALLAVASVRFGQEPTLGDALGWLAIAAAAVGAADLAARAGRPALADTLRGTSALLPVLGLALSAAAPGGLAATAFVAAGAAWAVGHARFRDPLTLLLAFLAVDGAVVVGLVRAAQWDPTLYVLPFVATAAVLSQHWRTRLHSGALEGIRWGAAGVLYAVAFGRLLLTADSVLPGVLIGLVGLGAGVGLQVRAWVWSGASFLVAVILLQAARFGIAQQLGLGALLFVAGVAVLGVTVALTLRRRPAAGAVSPDDPPAPPDGAGAAPALPSPSLGDPSAAPAGPAPVPATPARGGAPPPSAPPPRT